MPIFNYGGGGGSGGGSGGSGSQANVNANNSFSIYEEFDRATGSSTGGHMSYILESATAGTPSITVTGSAIQSDPSGTSGCMFIGAAAAAVAGTNGRVRMAIQASGRMLSMMTMGFKSEFRFVLESDIPSRIVTFGWLANNSATVALIDADGPMQGQAGILIKNRDVYLVRRGTDGVFSRKDLLCTVEVNKVYTISADTTGGQLVCTVTNNTDSVVAATATVPKWTGWTGATNMDMFGSAPSDPKYTVSFSVMAGITALNGASAIPRLLSLDSVYINCPKLR